MDILFSTPKDGPTAGFFLILYTAISRRFMATMLAAMKTKIDDESTVK